MNTATQYAKALYGLDLSKSDLPKIRQALGRRGHEKLLPNIYHEYKKLLLQDERLKAYKEVTPEKERVRVLLELYRKLIS